VYAAVLRAQIIAIHNAGAAQVRRHRRSEHHELGNVIVQAAQAIVHPRTDGWVKAFEDVAARVEVQRIRTGLRFRARTDHTCHLGLFYGCA
jgi:hypothetical protein